MPKFMYVEWPNDEKGHPIRNRWYADSAQQVHEIIEDLMESGCFRDIRAIVWPHEEE